MLDVDKIERIMLSLRNGYNIADGAEITLECNPMTRGEESEEYFSSLLRLGINRLSIGVQSANDGELKLIGRGHTFADAVSTYNSARRAGFDNINLDLMLAIPSQTMETLEESIDRLLGLSPEHISIYSLQLEEGTPLFKMRDRYKLPDDDGAADMYELTVRKMREAGYEHYEISNFAKDGRHSRHNMKYWTISEYLGFGTAAHSDIDGVRKENVSDLSEYLGGKWQKDGHVVGKREREEEYIMLGLRTKQGISVSDFSNRFGEDIFELYGDKLKKFESSSYIKADGDRIYLTEEGFEVSNSILCELLELNY